MVSTLAGGGAGSNGAWIDGAGAAAAFWAPTAIAVDPSGNALVGEEGTRRVRRVTPSGGTRLAARQGGSLGYTLTGWGAGYAELSVMQLLV